MAVYKGCQSCRTRRIKCDRRKPICLRCVKAQLSCVPAEALKQDAFVIHLENQFASGDSPRPRGPRSSLISLQPEFDIVTRACAYFLQNHFQVIQEVPDVAATWTECFHDWKAMSKKSKIVDLAFSSLALLVFSRARECLPAAVKASMSYQRLLGDMRGRMLQVGSSDLDADEIDASLLTAYFMARYESVLQQDSDQAIIMKSMKVWCHFDGVAAILKVWYDKRHDLVPTTVIKQARRTLLKSSLLREQRLPDWLLDGSHFGEQGIALEYDLFTVHTIDIYQRYLKIEQEYRSGCFDTSQIDRLYCETRTLDHTMRDWAGQLPSKFSYSISKLEDVSGDEFFYSQTVLSCTRPGYAAMWNVYFGVMMLATNTRIQILDLASSRPEGKHESERLDCLSHLKLTSDSLASFVPSCLDRVRVRRSLTASSETTMTSVELVNEPLKPYLANLVVWPMSIASSLQKLDDGRRHWFRSGLSRISSTSCECLIAYAMSDHWAIL